MTDAVELADLAKILGVQPAVIAALEREGLPFEHKKAKRYRLTLCVPWYVDYRLRKSANEIPPRASKTAFAQLLGVSTRQVTNLVEKGIQTIVDGNSRSFPLPEALHWYIKFKLTDAGKGGANVSDLDRARLKKMEIEIQQSELQLLRERGELVDRLTVERLIADLLQVLRGEMLNFPARWAADLVGIPKVLEMRLALKKAVNEGIARLGKAARAAGERIQVIAEGGGEDDDAPEDTDGPDDADRNAS